MGNRARPRSTAAPPGRTLIPLLLATAVVLGVLPAAGAGTGPARPVLQDCRISDSLELRSHAARCGRLTRPENPAAPEGRRIELFVAVIPALSPSPATAALTVIAGGPGGASTEFYASFSPAFEAVRRSRDILLVDQRGTGRSGALECDFAELGTVAGSAQEIVRLARRCLAELEADPRYYTTSVAVRDLDAARAALGYEKLDVYGASYGTRVALHYLRRFPDRTRTVILDGVVPAQIPIAPEIALDAQAALERIFARCLDSPRCAERFGSLHEQFRALRERLREAPVDVALPDPYTGEPRTVTLGENELRVAVRMLSYDSASASLLPLMIEQAWAGHYLPLAAQAVMVLDSLDEALSYGMHNAVVCTEDAPFFDGFLARELDRSALARTYLGEQQLETLEELCAVWPEGVIDEDFKTPVRSDVPVLVLSGSEDPVTPPRNGQRAIGPDGRYLSNALHVIAPGQGHGVAASGCLPRLLGEFVEEASVQGLDTTCVERLAPAAFFLDYTGTAP